MFDLEKELRSSELIKQKVQDYKYAQKLYAALCNIQWAKIGSAMVLIDDDVWTCSWRCAGEIVAELRNSGEDYLDFYCSGIGRGVAEGIVDPEIENDLKDLGWVWRLWPAK